jgi:hypothetical protein
MKINNIIDRVQLTKREQRLVDTQAADIIYKGRKLLCVKLHTSEAKRVFSKGKSVEWGLKRSHDYHLYIMKDIKDSRVGIEIIVPISKKNSVLAYFHPNNEAVNNFERSYKEYQIIIKRIKQVYGWY